MRAPDVNQLRRLLASGAITEDDLNGMFLSGSAGGRVGPSMSAPPQNALVRALSPQEEFASSDQSGPLPMGSMRNEATGKVTYFQPDASAPRSQADPGFSATPYPAPRVQQRQSAIRVVGAGNDGMVTDLGDEPARAEPIDYTRPAIDIPGVGRGHYGRDGRSAFVDNPDGSRTKVLLGYDAAASDARNFRALKMDEMRQGLERGDADIERVRQATESNRQAQELAAQSATIGPKAPQGYRWNGDALEPIPGGPADPRTVAKVDSSAIAKNDARSRVDKMLDQIEGNYKSLQKMGGAISTASPSRQNIQNRIAASDTGQLVGGAFGTEEQSIRNSIRQTIPLLMNEIRSATGMSAKAMDSNAELQFYLRAATDPSMDVEANFRAIQSLRDTYGTGAASRGTGEGEGQSSVPPPESRVVGRKYETPRGPLVWLGNGQWRKP